MLLYSNLVSSWIIHFRPQRSIETIVNLKTIVDHCPQNFENHRKTIDTNGWALKKTFNGDGPTLSKPSKNHWPQWWPGKKTLTIPSLWKIDHRCGLACILVSTKSFYRRVHIQKAFLQCGKAYESSRRWFWFNICHKFFNVCAIRALPQQMLSWVVFT